jgi:cytochrome c peroxidase
VGLGVVFFVFGLDKLPHPNHWLAFVPASLGHFFEQHPWLTVYRFLWFQGLVEAVLGLQILTGLLTRSSAVGCALMLTSILYAIGFDPIGIRDFGLWCASVALACLGAGDWSLDAWFARRTAMKSVRFWFYAGWVAALALLGIVLWRQFPTISSRRLEATSTSRDAGLMMEDTSISLNEPIQPLPLTVTLDVRKVTLGSRLFNEPRLSHDNTISCASCHNLRKGGTDQLPKSIGIKGAVGDINAPTVFNSGFNFKQFWDGRANTLEEQAAGPIHNPKEMGSSWAEVIAKLTQDPSHVHAFDALYPDGITSANIQDALATFERSLTTPNARFDKFLRGDQTALTSEEKAGYRLFKDLGCITCHQGVNIGGNMFQTMGKMGDYFHDRGNVTQADYGRYNVTGDARDRFKFKVPTLRNIARTAPYFHDASAQTLDEAIRTMGKYQLGFTLSDEEVRLLRQYLETLTGERDGLPL